MPPRERDRCYWCGEPDPAERDHVFPKGLFAEPRPSDLTTVPACVAHNRLFSFDEEYFRDFVLASSHSHPEARKLWETKTRRALSRKPAYRAMLAAQIRRLEVRTVGGIFLGPLDALFADSGRINQVLRKMTRGLYYHEYSAPLGPISLTIDQVRPDRQPPSEVAALVHGLPPPTRVGHVWYRFARASDEPAAVAGMIAFFHRVAFIVIGMPSAHDDRVDLPRGRRRSGALWLPEDR